MKTSAIRHLSFYPFVQPLARNKARFRLDAAYGDLLAAVGGKGGAEVHMDEILVDEREPPVKI